MITSRRLPYREQVAEIHSVSFNVKYLNAVEAFVNFMCSLCKIYIKLKKPMTSPDSDKPDDSSCLKEAVQLRRKRLEIRRLKSVYSRDNLERVDDDCVKMKKPRVHKKPSDSPAQLKKEDGSNEYSSLSFASSSSALSDHSLENEGVPVEILVTTRSEICRRGEEIRSFECLSHGSASVCGRRREMEDAVTVVPGFLSGELAYDFFGVYDGHGGSRVANACRDRLHWVLAKEIEGREAAATRVDDGPDWNEVMVGCFSKMDDEINGSGYQVEDGSASVKTIGSTAVVALVGTEKLVIANCGDSRAVLSRGGVAVALSRDHKPDRPDEMERVEAAGGRVINWNGYRVLGVLATSRSIGDHYLKPFVISEPEVTVSDRTKADEFLILASDGLWDVVSNEIACKVVRRCFDGRLVRRFSKTANTGVSGGCASDAAAVLTELAMARGSKDNISVVVVELRKL